MLKHFFMYVNTFYIQTYRYIWKKNVDNIFQNHLTYRINVMMDTDLDRVGET